MPNTQNQVPIKDLAKAVLLSGRLSEIHVQSLKTYPFVVFNGLEEAETVYDINTDRDAQKTIPSSVNYYLTFKEGVKPPSKTKSVKLIKYLTDAVATLLWNGIEVKVYNKETGKQLNEK